MLLKVILLGLHAKPHSAVSISIVFSTLARLSKGSPIPIKTALVSSSASSIPINWEIISFTCRLPLKPCLPVIQNLHPILHPACDETHIVARGSSGIITASTAVLVWQGKRYFFVPSVDACTWVYCIRPTSHSRERVSLADLERFVICSMDVTRFL